MIAQRIDVVDSKFRDYNSGKFGQIHAGLAAISITIRGTLDISSKGPGCDSQSVPGFKGKVEIGFVPRLLTVSKKRSAEGNGWQTLYEKTTR
jgi:hypothetical protein